MSDDEYNRLLKQFVQKIRGALTIKQSLERLIQAGRRTGRTDLQIGDDIRRELKGELPDVTIRKYLPPSMKHQEMTRQPNSNNKFAIHVSQIKEPEIPPSPHIVREVEPQVKDVMDTDGNKVTIPIEDETGKIQEVTITRKGETPTESLVPKEPIQMGSIIATLNCKEFRMRLNIACANGENLKLKINNNVVTQIFD